jgi:hypothetical protein
MNLRKIFLLALLCICGFFIEPIEIYPQETADFKEAVKKKLKSFQNITLEKICPTEKDATAKRIFSEYGAIFISNGTKLPSRQSI